MGLLVGDLLGMSQVDCDVPGYTKGELWQWTNFRQKLFP
ncbi:uncharacterized protein METZ01_LOCUS286273 [marine metagenome]|uniref:Uncharacterized protein n=1 Tax=marine metagenome TaxID=408172 RepID=A0A382L9W7_9ZZZZ